MSYPLMTRVLTKAGTRQTPKVTVIRESQSIFAGPRAREGGGERSTRGGRDDYSPPCSNVAPPTTR